MPLDPSLSLQAGRGVPTAMDTVSKIAAMQNALNANKLFAAKVAAGEAYQHSIDPATGLPSVSRFGQLVRGNPLMAVDAQDAMQQAYHNQQAHLAVATSQLGLGIKKLTAVGEALGPLATQKGATMADAKAAVMPLVQAKIMSPEHGATLLSAFSKGDVQEVARKHLDMAYAMQGRLADTLQKLQLVHQGNRIGYLQANPLAPQFRQMVGSARLGLSPGEAATPITLTNPNGSQTTMPKGTYAALRPVVTGPSIAEQHAEATTGTGNANIGVSLTNEAAGSSRLLAQVQEMDSEVNSANPGPLAPLMAKLGGVFQQFGVKIGPQATAAQLVHKTSALLAAQTGSNSDAQLFNAIQATPNNQMTIGAVRAASGILTGLARYKQARAEAWLDWQKETGHGDASAPQFLAHWRDSVAAAPFIFASLPRQEQVRMVRSLTQGQKEKLAGQINEALTDGYIQPGEVGGE